MKVLHIVDTLECGGLEKFAVELSRSLIHRGHSATICCLRNHGQMAADALKHGIPVTALDARPGVDVKAIWNLSRMMIRDQFDVVHSHNMKPLMYGALAGTMVNVEAMIHTRHGREPKKAPGLIWALNDKLVAVSEDAGEQLLRSNNIPAHKVTVIANGVDLEAYRHADENRLNRLRNELELKPGQFVAGIVARLSSEKDHKSLLNAFAQVKAAIPDARLLVIGDGPLGPDLQNQARSLSLEDNVSFLGFRDDVQDLLQLLDVYVLSSTTEGMSLTLLEAMAAGLPVVATHVGGTPQVVKHGLTGLLVPPENHPALADALITLAEAPEKASLFGRAGRNRVASHFSIDAMTDRYISLYNQTLRRDTQIPPRQARKQEYLASRRFRNFTH